MRYSPTARLPKSVSDCHAASLTKIYDAPALGCAETK
jgi:hypothetical protein